MEKAEGYEDSELLDWEVDVIQPLRVVLGSPEWVELPQRDPREDHRVIARFALELCEGWVREELLTAIQGRGAFGRFRDVIHRRGLQDAWFTYRREALAEDAKSWLEAEGIAFGP